MFKAFGIHCATGSRVNYDLIDAYNVVYNFRFAAYSTRLLLRGYAVEGVADAVTFGPAFWPTSRFSRVVADYERALIVGSFDLDVTAGMIPVEGIGMISSFTEASKSVRESGNGGAIIVFGKNRDLGTNGGSTFIEFEEDGVTPSIFANMQAETVGISLADIDKARIIQAFAKLRTAYAGNETTGYSNDDIIVAELMQGFAVPLEHERRPWLLDSKRVPIGFNERYATDSGSLDQSVTQGRVFATLSVNLPVLETGGMIIYTVEVLPERIYER